MSTFSSLYTPTPGPSPTCHPLMTYPLTHIMSANRGWVTDSEGGRLHTQSFAEWMTAFETPKRHPHTWCRCRSLLPLLIW